MGPIPRRRTVLDQLYKNCKFINREVEYFEMSYDRESNLANSESKNPFVFRKTAYVKLIRIEDEKEVFDEGEYIRATLRREEIPVFKRKIIKIHEEATIALANWIKNWESGY